MELFDLLKRVVESFESLKISYIITGSVASMAYGEPRFTNDIDIVAEIKEYHIKKLLILFPPEEFYLSEEGISEAIVNNSQFNIIHPESGLKIDVIIKKNTAFDNSRFSRMRHIYPAETFMANFASPEDIIIKKMEYYKEGGSDKHLRDITGILKVSGDIVNRDYIGEWAKRLNLLDIWDLIKKRINDNPEKSKY